MPHLTINGESRDYTPEDFPANLLVLVTALGFDPESLVAELDGEVIPATDFASTPLKDNAKLELVRFVGGG